MFFGTVSVGIGKFANFSCQPLPVCSIMPQNLQYQHGKTIGSVIGLFIASLSLAQTPSLQDLGVLTNKSGTTTIYTAKAFITMDPKQQRAEAVAVKDGRFIAVGKLADVRAAAGMDAKVDKTLADKTVIAGFVEQHVHPVLAALTMNTKVISIEDWDTIDGFSPAVRDPKGYEQRLKKALSEHTEKSNPFITWGYHHYMHGELSRATLNKLAPDFPVIVWHRSCHEFFFNDAALKLAGIDEKHIARLPKSAQEQISLEKGHFFEQGMMAVLDKIAPIMASPAAFKNGLEFSVKYYHRNGITVCCEPGGFVSKPVQDLINSVYSGDEVPFNHYFMVDGKTFAAKHPRDAKALVADSEQVLTWGKGRTAYLPKQVKLFTDGAIFSQLMQMKDPYTDGHKGAWIVDPPVFGYAFQSYWDAGYQIHIHNNGDAGFDVVLGELEKAMKRAPRKDHRTVLVHFGFAQADQVKKWIELGGIVSSNPYYVTALAGPYEKIGLGADRAKNIAPHKYVLDNKGSLSFHSDMPMAPAKPLQLVWAGVNRETYEGNVAGAEHIVPLDVALKAITIDAAYSIQLEKEVGSIEVGKRANLTVLEKDPYEVKAMDLKAISIWGTMLEGKVQPVSVTTQKSSEQKADRLTRVTIPQDQSQPARSWDTRAKHLACAPGCSCSIGHLFGRFLETQLAVRR
jgi:predicted amidohydrolase YtcJ